MIHFFHLRLRDITQVQNRSSVITECLIAGFSAEGSLIDHVFEYTSGTPSVILISNSSKPCPGHTQRPRHRDKERA